MRVGNEIVISIKRLLNAPPWRGWAPRIYKAIFNDSQSGVRKSLNVIQYAEVCIIFSFQSCRVWEEPHLELISTDGEDVLFIIRCETQVTRVPHLCGNGESCDNSIILVKAHLIEIITSYKLCLFTLKDYLWGEQTRNANKIIQLSSLIVLFLTELWASGGGPIRCVGESGRFKIIICNDQTGPRWN